MSYQPNPSIEMTNGTKKTVEELTREIIELTKKGDLQGLIKLYELMPTEENSGDMSQFEGIDNQGVNMQMQFLFAFFLLPVLISITSRLFWE